MSDHEPKPTAITAIAANLARIAELAAPLNATTAEEGSP